MTHDTALPVTDGSDVALPATISRLTLRELVDQIRRMELDLEFGGLPEEKRAALRRTIEEALSILEKEEARQQAKPAGGISRAARKFYRNILTTALLLTRTVRFLINRALGLAAMVFVVHFGFQFFPHPAKWDQWWWVVRLNDLLAPLLAQLDAVLEWPEAIPFYTLVLALACMVVLLMVDSRLTRVCVWLRKKRDSKVSGQRERAYGGPSPTTWLGASPYAARPALALRDPHASW